MGEREDECCGVGAGNEWNAYEAASETATRGLSGREGIYTAVPVAYTNITSASTHSRVLNEKIAFLARIRAFVMIFSWISESRKGRASETASARDSEEEDEGTRGRHTRASMLNQVSRDEEECV